MGRVREIPVRKRGYYVAGGSEVTFVLNDISQEYFAESTYPGPCDCFHSRFVPYTGFYVTSGGYPHYYENTIHLLSKNVIPLSDAGWKATTALNWGKLPTSSKFGILQFLAELDDTLAMFTSKFWKSLSYGSFTWGVLPFVNDVKALIETIRNLSQGLDGLKAYEDEITFTDEVNLASFYDTYTCKSNVTVRNSGSITYPVDVGILQLYDAIGFHPDLSTAWDLVPLSFLVDYLLPIGDWLDSLHYQGWCRTLDFSGWTTVHVTGTCTQTAWWQGQGFAPQPVEYEYFQRFHCYSTLTIDDFPPKDLSIKTPSPKQLFDTLYVLLQNKRR